MVKTVQGKSTLAIRNRLVSRGWCQGSLGPIEGPNCLVGAMSYSKADLPEGFYKFLGASGLISWNDAPDRTEGEVIGVLDQYIAELEGWTE